MTIFVPQINRKLHANEHGSTKQAASKACALSLTRQLYHCGVVEQFTGERKKKERPKTAPFLVEVSSELKNSLAEVCEIFQIQPNLTFDEVNPTSLVPDQKKNLFDPCEKRPGAVISWCPSLPNWNPWTACNIDEGPLSTQSLEQISDSLYQSYVELCTNDKTYQMNLKDRSSLPVYSFKDEILNMVQNNPVIIVRGATGCGKTTQIPQYILESYLESQKGAHCNIVVTQPRRISAVSVADRVATERAEELGYSVGYSVRFESVLPRPYAGLLFCTVGVLLRKLEAGLRGISHVIVDEIHERDINTDFLLVLLKEMLAVHPELRVILMSATIDTSLFAEYFGNCPVVEVHGRTFPVQDYFLEDIVQMLDFVPPPSKKRKNKNSNDDDEDDECDEAVVAAAEDETDCNAIIPEDYSQRTRDSMKKLSEKNLSFELIEALLNYIVSLNHPGAVLIFLPGWNLIQALLKHLRDHPLFGAQHKFILLPLHSQIPREEQYKVFEEPPQGKMKIILSTNIAESSVTINDIVFVIDSCKVKQKIFTSRNNMTNYATVWASKANLEQRKGRAGRVRPGFCFYLISRARHSKLDNHATPEIFRTPLLELALSIKLLRLGEIGEFLSRAIEPPPLDAVAEAEVALVEMHALDTNAELTPIGRILARLPIEPRLGKMIIMGCIFYVGDAVCTIAAATTFPEPFQHDGKHLRMMHKAMAGKRQSDHVALLVAFEQWLRAHRRGETAEAEFCERKCLNQQTMRMTLEARNQLRDIMRLSGFPEDCLTDEGKPMDPNNNDARLDLITSLLTYALYPNVCYHTEKRKLITCDGKQALIHTNSVNCGREIPQFASPFFVFGEKIKTRAVSAKQMTMVTPLQLMLFSSDKVDTVPGEKDLVCLDNWIYVKIDRDLAAVAVACRSVVDAVIAQCTMDPNLVANRSNAVEKFVYTMIMLSDQNSCHIQFGRADDSIIPPLPRSGQQSLMESGHNGEHGDGVDNETDFEPAAKRPNNATEYFSQFSSLGYDQGFERKERSSYFGNRLGSNNRGGNGFSSFNNRGRGVGFNNNRGGFGNRGGGFNNNRGGFGNRGGGFNNNNNNNNNRGGFNNNRGNDHFNSQPRSSTNNNNNKSNGNYGNNFGNQGFQNKSNQDSSNGGALNRPLPPHLMNSQGNSNNFQSRAGFSNNRGGFSNNNNRGSFSNNNNRGGGFGARGGFGRGGFNNN